LCKAAGGQIRRVPSCRDQRLCGVGDTGRLDADLPKLSDGGGNGAAEEKAGLRRHSAADERRSGCTQHGLRVGQQRAKVRAEAGRENDRVKALGGRPLENDALGGKACDVAAKLDPSVAYRIWLQIFISFSITGTQSLVPFRPAKKYELILFEQVARAMEIFAISHEYGHHHLGHGRHLDCDPKQEEFQADQFALRICYKVEPKPLIADNPYLASGSGGIVLLMALRTLRAFKEGITGNNLSPSVAHPSIQERFTRFDSVAVLKPAEFAALKGFRIASERIMTAVDGVLMDLLDALPEERRKELRSFTSP
jgi:hypothetical protein